MTNREIIRLIVSPEHLNEETLPAIARMVEDFPYFQTARLLYVMNLWAIKDSDFSSELKKAAFYVGDRKALFFNLTDEHLAYIYKVLKEDISLKDSFDLIDTYLTEIGKSEIDNSIQTASGYNLNQLLIDADAPVEPSMKHQNVIDHFLEKDKTEPVKIHLATGTSSAITAPAGSEETLETSTFFSETLAKIYIKQQKYEKALEIIHKLSLLYPEKSVYFADQIRFLEKLIINKKIE